MLRNTFLLIVTLALVTGACGGDDEADGVASIDDLSEAGTSTMPAPAASEGELVVDEEKVLAFAACMRDEGIDFPDPVVDADGNVGFDMTAMSGLADVDEDEINAAFEPCVHHLEGVNFGFEAIFDAEFQDEILVFAGCMRENGIDMPDPDFSGIMDGPGMEGERGIFGDWQPDMDDPDFEAALEACEDLLPGIPGIANG